MKKLILSELLLLFLATTFMTDSPPPGWYQQTINLGNRLITDIYFLDSLTGWVVTDAGTGGQDSGSVYKTTDGGSIWNLQFRSYAKFYGVQFLDVNTGYAAGDLGPGVMYKTINGGLNWSTIFNAGDGLRDLFFINKDTGWTTDPGGAFGVGVIKTTNGGSNWIQQMSGDSFPQKLFFISKDTGWVGSNEANGKLYNTTNGGLNWNLQYTSNAPFESIFFIDGLNGWIRAGTTNGIQYTTNGGFNWINAQGNVVGGFDTKFINDSIGYSGTYSSFKILKSTDGGKTWGYQVTPILSANLVSALRNDTSNAWAGQIMHTADGGGPITYIGIKSSSTFVTAFELKQNYPNPFNPTTTIDFDVKKTSRITLKLYSVDGREIDELLDYERFPAGYYYIDFDADDDFASGVYLYQMTGWTEDKKEIFIDTKKMVLLK